MQEVVKQSKRNLYVSSKEREDAKKLVELMGTWLGTQGCR